MKAPAGKAYWQKRSKDGKTITGGFCADNATAAENEAFLKQLCGDAVYDGPKWWRPEVAKELGIKVYNGKNE